MTPDEANERLRQMCIEATYIADEQGWDWTIKASIGKRTGWCFQVLTDKVSTKRRDAFRAKQATQPQQLTID